MRVRGRGRPPAAVSAGPVTGVGPRLSHSSGSRLQWRRSEIAIEIEIESQQGRARARIAKELCKLSARSDINVEGRARADGSRPDPSLLQPLYSVLLAPAVNVIS